MGQAEGVCNSILTTHDLLSFLAPRLELLIAVLRVAIVQAVRFRQHSLGRIREGVLVVRHIRWRQVLVVKCDCGVGFGREGGRARR